MDRLFAFFCSVILCLLLVVGSAEAQLHVGFYSKSCPHAEFIISEEINKAIRKSSSIGGPLLRIFFHDCFVRGCDASLLLNATNPKKPTEKNAPPNQFLRGFTLIDKIKARLEKACPSTVSCADLIALIARDVVHADNGPFWEVPTGRRDGVLSNASEALGLPAFSANISTLKTQFRNKGLSAEDLVLLSGAHTIGNAHCFTITKRLYNFSGRGDNKDVDPKLDRNYLLKLRAKCSAGSKDALKLIEMDPGSFTTFDNSYFKLVVKNRGLFQSDSALLDDPETRAYVIRLAKLENSVFFKEFGQAMVNMGNVGVLTGKLGQVRKNCARVN
ncbi:peroxidase 56-like [Wolffia australiana]